ncbi:MAG TPA: hypothetical protein VMD55_08730 [Terracidiphilus sp.]|nr:hypothetical protein [Terracidiphilus sp.]
MSRTSSVDKAGNNLAFWQGGKLSSNAVQRQLAQIQRAGAAEIAEKGRIQQQAARYLRQVQTPAKPEKGETADKALKSLRALTDRISKQKKLPRPPIIPPNPVWGSYTMTFTPPDYTELGGDYAEGQITSVTGDPTISSTGNVSTGQMSCTVESNYDSPSSGTASNLFGFYFQPHFPSATVEVSFSSQLNFYWYVNSIRNKYAFSAGQGLLEIYQYFGGPPTTPLSRGAFIGWGVDAINNLDFDFYSGPGPTWSLTAPVNGNYFYFVVFRLSASATASGWPGSLAGASATVTVPSVTVTVTGNPLRLP